MQGARWSVGLANGERSRAEGTDTCARTCMHTYRCEASLKANTAGICTLCFLRWKKRLRCRKLQSGSQALDSMTVLLSVK